MADKRKIAAKAKRVRVAKNRAKDRRIIDAMQRVIRGKQGRN